MKSFNIVLIIECFLVSLLVLTIVDNNVLASGQALEALATGVAGGGANSLMTGLISQIPAKVIGILQLGLLSRLLRQRRNRDTNAGNNGIDDDRDGQVDESDELALDMGGHKNIMLFLGKHNIQVSNHGIDNDDDEDDCENDECSEDDDDDDDDDDNSNGNGGGNNGYGSSGQSYAAASNLYTSGEPGTAIYESNSDLTEQKTSKKKNLKKSSSKKSKKDKKKTKKTKIESSDDISGSLSDNMPYEGLAYQPLMAMNSEEKPINVRFPWLRKLLPIGGPTGADVQTPPTTNTVSAVSDYDSVDDKRSDINEII